MATWIKTYKGKKYDEFHDCVNSIWDCTCSECGWRTGQQGVNFDYCPKCGTRMENANCSDVMPKEDVIALLNEMKKDMALLSHYESDDGQDLVMLADIGTLFNERIHCLKENKDGSNN